MKRTWLFVVVLVVAVGGCKKKDDNKKGEIKRPKATPGKHILTPKIQPKKKLQLRVDGFATPESVVHDVEADVYLVSNINGEPAAADGNGFISRVKPDGSVEALKWIDGERRGVTLNAPKGMAIVGDTIYVADINAVRMFDRKTGAPKGQISIAGSTFLNDVAAAPSGVVYVSDSGLTPELKPSGSDAIYAIEAGKARKLVSQSKQLDLGRPNGLWVSGADVWVVTFGSGEIYKIDKDGKRGALKKLPKGSLDGIAPSGVRNQVVISSWAARAVYLGPVSGPWMEAVKNVKTPADVAVDNKRKRVLVPLFQDNQLLIHGL